MARIPSSAHWRNRATKPAAALIYFVETEAGSGKFAATTTRPTGSQVEAVLEETSAGSHKYAFTDAPASGGRARAINYGSRGLTVEV